MENVPKKKITDLETTEAIASCYLDDGYDPTAQNDQVAVPFLTKNQSWIDAGACALLKPVP